MSRYKGKMETSKRGFIPRILDLDSDPLLDIVFDATVEYGTGCWIDTSDDPEAAVVQAVVWEHFNDSAVPPGYLVFNTCNDYRICFNPNCLDLLEIPT